MGFVFGRVTCFWETSTLDFASPLAHKSKNDRRQWIIVGGKRAGATVEMVAETDSEEISAKNVAISDPTEKFVFEKVGLLKRIFLSPGRF